MTKKMRWNKDLDLMIAKNMAFSSNKEKAFLQTVRDLKDRGYYTTVKAVSSRYYRNSPAIDIMRGDIYSKAFDEEYRKSHTWYKKLWYAVRSMLDMSRHIK